MTSAMAFFKSWRSLSELPREIWILCFATFVNRMGSMVLPFLILYLTRGLHYSVGEAGFVLSLYGVVALITGPIAGRLCDAFGAVKIMTSSLLFSGVVLLLFPLAKTFAIIIFATIFLAAFSETFRPANLTALGVLTAPHQKKAAYSLNRLAVNLGMSISPVMAGLLASVSFNALFWVDGITTLLSSAVLLFFSQEFIQKKIDDASVIRPPKQTNRFFDGALADRDFCLMLVACVPVGIVFFQHQSTMPLFFVHDLGFSEKTYGLLLAINTALVLLFEIPLNAATAHWEHSRAMALGAFLFGVGFGALAFVTEIWGVALTIAIWSFGEMILFPAISAYISDRAPHGRQGEYMGFFFMSFSFAFMLGPLLGTQALERFGARVLWPATFFMGLISTLILSRLNSKVKHGGEAHS